jgi:hypothetical protein
MSLNFELGKIADWETVVAAAHDPKKMSVVTSAVIWTTLAVDMGEITGANVEEFIWRNRMTQLIYGAELGFAGEPVVYLTEADIRAHIGLTTNVTTVKSRAKWLARFITARLPMLEQDKSAREIEFEQAAICKAKQATGECAANENEMA